MGLRGLIAVLARQGASKRGADEFNRPANTDVALVRLQNLDPIAQHVSRHALRQDFLPYEGPQESDYSTSRPQ